MLTLSFAPTETGFNPGVFKRIGLSAERRLGGGQNLLREPEKDMFVSNSYIPEVPPVLDDPELEGLPVPEAPGLVPKAPAIPED